MELWEVFKKLLDEKGVKISDVVKETGIPYTTVDSIIKKQLRDIKFDNAVKIAEYFGVPIDYLATGKITKRPDPDTNIREHLEGIDLLNEYGIKRLKLYLEGVLLADKDCLKERR